VSVACRKSVALAGSRVCYRLSSGRSRMSYGRLGQLALWRVTVAYLMMGETTARNIHPETLRHWLLALPSDHAPGNRPWKSRMRTCSGRMVIRAHSLNVFLCAFRKKSPPSLPR
jgi:hypothetical protein